jgi:hypothetical protein
LLLLNDGHRITTVAIVQKEFLVKSYSIAFAILPSIAGGLALELLSEVIVETSNQDLKRKSKKARIIFTLYLACYIILLGVSIAYSRCRFQVEGEKQTWFYFAWIIGGIYVFIAFYYFYENYLLPYLKDLEKRIPLKRNIYSWLFEWILPAIAVQYFIFIGFWMTVQVVPFKESFYTNPYMYGQVYKKMDNYLSPEILAAGFSKKLDGVDPKKEEKNLEERAQFLENEFSVHLKKFKHPEKKTGQEYLDSINEIISIIYRIPFCIALTFSFLGALIYSLNDTVYRFFISDLYPKTFVSYLIRFLFAPALSLVLAYFLMNDWWINGAPILFFLVGFFPQVALRYVEEKARTFLRLKREKKQEIPLGYMQGMTEYIIYRFREIGVGDAQNLAYSDLNYLRKNWYNDRQLCDFVAQALLLIHLREHFSTLQNAGIRNIVSFKNVIVDPDACNKYSEKLGIPAEKLSVVMNLIQARPLADRIETIEKIMNEFDTKEIENLISSNVGGR